MTYRNISCILAILAMSGCSKPLLVVNKETPAATVEFRNLSTGYLQQFVFDDPVTCSGAKLISHIVQPNEAQTHQIPAEKIITIRTNAWNLPAPPGYIAWCQSTAFSTRLNPGQSYRVEFIADAEKKLCGAFLTTTTGSPASAVRRTVSGTEIGGGGVLAGSLPCSATDDLSQLK